MKDKRQMSTDNIVGHMIRN